MVPCNKHNSLRADLGTNFFRDSLRGSSNMYALQPTFMLPPNFLFPPDGKIKPGIDLEESKGLPDPQEQLQDCNVSDLDPVTLPEFRYRGDARSNSKIGFWIAILSLIEIGLGGGRGQDDNLVIGTGPAKISTFS